MALSADRDVEFFTMQELIDLPVDDNVVIYKGAFVGRNRATGYVRPLTTGDEFLGVAYRRADNTGDGHAAGAINVRLHQSIDIVHAISGVSLADVGKDAYASADGELTLDPKGASRMGRVTACPSAGTARVRCQPTQSVSGVLEGMPLIELADADATLTLDDVNRVLLMANTAERTMTLPTAASVRAGGWIRFVKTSADVFSITLDGAGSETIDGATSLATIDAQYDSVLMVSTGAEWVVLSRDIA